jgi:hypothetical protein
MPIPGNDPDVDALSISAIKLLKKASNTSVGSDVFDAIEATPITPEQKQQVYRNLAEYVTDHACTNLNNPATVMRSNSAGTQLMTKYMETYAADYLAAVEHQALEAVNEIELPAEGFTKAAYEEPDGTKVEAMTNPALSPTNVPKAGFRSSPEDESIGREDLSPEATAQWDAIYRQAGQSIVTAMQEQMPKLSPEAIAFLKTCGDTARAKLPGQNGESAATFIMSNTMALRGALLHTKADSDGLKLPNGATIDQKIRGKILGEANGVAQSYINWLPQNGNEQGKISEASKLQNKIVNLLRENGLEQSRQIFSDISKGQLPATPPNRLAPDNAHATLNQAIPGRQERFAPPAVVQPAVVQPAVVQPAVVQPAVVQPAVEVAGEESKKSKIASVRDALKGVSNRIGTALERKGDEQSLSDLRKNNSAILQDYEKLKDELAALKKKTPEQKPDGLNAIDAAQVDPEANEKFKYGENYDAIKAKEQQLAQMRDENPGLKQLERNKVGQVIHSKVRDAAKAVGSKISHH